MSGERGMHEKDAVKSDAALLCHELRRRRRGALCVHFHHMKNDMPTKCELNNAENDGALRQRALSTLRAPRKANIAGVQRVGPSVRQSGTAGRQICTRRARPSDERVYISGDRTVGPEW